MKEKRATRAKQLFRGCPIAYKSIDFYQVKSIQQFFDQKIGLIEQIKIAKNNWQDWQREANINHDPVESAFYEQLEMGLK